MTRYVEQNLEEAYQEVLSILEEQRRRMGTFVISLKRIRTYVSERVGGHKSQVGRLSRAVMERLEQEGVVQIWDEWEMRKYNRRVYQVRA